MQRPKSGKPDKTAFGKRLNALLDQRKAPPVGEGRGIWVAERYRVKPPSAWAWVHGKSVPDAANLRMIAIDLGVTSDYLLYGDNLNETASTPFVGSFDAETSQSRLMGIDHLTVAIRITTEVMAEKRLHFTPALHAAFVKALHDRFQEGESEEDVRKFARQMALVISAGGNNSGQGKHV